MKLELGQRVTTTADAYRHLRSGGKIQESPTSKIVIQDGKLIRQSQLRDGTWWGVTVRQSILKLRNFKAL